MEPFNSHSIDKTIKTLKTALILGFIIMGIANVLLLVLYIKEKKRNESTTMYVLKDEFAYKAIPLEEKESRGMAELKNHISMFMFNMFSHDQYNYNDRIENALKLIDRTDGKRIYNELESGKVYEIYKKYNSRTELKIDSVIIDNSKSLITGRVYAKQTAIYSDQRKMVPLAAKFEIENTFRSEGNPHGLQITNFNFIRYDQPEGQSNSTEK